MFFFNSAYAEEFVESVTELPQGAVQDVAEKASGWQQYIQNPMFLIIIFFAILYFIMIRPQQKRQKKLNETINALKAGDRVMMTCGIYGTIDSVIDPQTFVLTIANGVKVQIARAAIASKTDQSSASTISDKR